MRKKNQKGNTGWHKNKKAAKRLAAFMLAGVLGVGMLTACGNSSSGTDSETAQSQESEAKTEQLESYTAVMPTEAEESEIYVEPIEGLSEDFIKGMDISSVIAEEESGVVYYDEQGNETDLFHILADAGVNYIRVRVWNDPYDSDGNGYGGGNNDVEKACEIGKRAAACGMKLLVDFHYSDFWADPNKQFAPKDWKHLVFEDKKQALYDFTYESLNTIAESGADIGMVQIGNEINNGLAGEEDSERIIELLKQGSSAVRAFSEEAGKDVQIAVHYTEVDDQDAMLKRAAALDEAELDYDIFGISYYPYWHGSMENMSETLQKIASDYGVKTCVLETSYMYTTEDGDEFDNSVSEADLLEDYTASVQSQATCVRDVMAAASEAGAIGVFYWEGAWVPVGSNASENEKLWEEFGSGWASSYSAKYDPDDAGQYYGGCSWDNQAFFDFEGKALPSINVFKYVNYGTICDAAVDFVKECSVDVNVGEELVMPETVEAVYNDRSKNGGIPVEWDEASVNAIDTSKMGEYDVIGKLEDGTTVTCLVKVADVNYVVNNSFEENDTSMWQVTYDGDTNPTDIQNKESDAVTGENAFHFYDEQAFSFSVEQTVTGLSEGAYTLNANIQGGDVGNDAEIVLYAIIDGQTYESDPVTLAGWVNWQVPEIKDLPVGASGEITVGMRVKSAAKGWGTIDDFYLYKQK
jgi:arabinogalactan endo-1,4-beta-galactosidase